MIKDEKIAFAVVPFHGSQGLDDSGFEHFFRHGVLIRTVNMGGKGIGILSLFPDKGFHPFFSA